MPSFSCFITIATTPSVILAALLHISTMFDLEDITYSREGTISAIRDYYQFLTKMYLPESAILEPPALLEGHNQRKLAGPGRRALLIQ